MPIASASGSNPFATRFIRPGAIPYVFPSGVTVDGLIATLEAQSWRGSIIGPHGSGKSSLLAILIPELQNRGRRIVQQQLQGGERQLRWRELNSAGWNSQTLVVIDGYEQLSRGQRLLLLARCWWHRAGLLVTAHQSVRLKPVFATVPSVQIAQTIVQQLLPPDDGRIQPDDVAQEYARRQGNLREMLLGLFDVYRARS